MLWNSRMLGLHNPQAYKVTRELYTSRSEFKRTNARLIFPSPERLNVKFLKSTVSSQPPPTPSDFTQS